MGALVVLDYLLQRPQGLAGAIVSGVPIEPAGVAKPTLVALARVLSGVLPRVSVDLGLDGGALSRDPGVVEDYRSDPLVTSRATLRWGTESLGAVRRIKEGMGGIEVPLLVLHGEADRLSLVTGARALFEGVAHPVKELRIYPEAYHEPHNDLGHEEVVGDVSAWLDRLIGGPA
jgi:alpha-beta hydrolase superfamily lysophospholipase